MAHVKNNGIALAVQILLVGVFCSFVFLSLDFASDINELIFALAISFVCILVYLACGFFLLKPVKEFLFLSIIFVAVVLVIIYFFLYTQKIYGGMFCINPIAYISYIPLLFPLPEDIGQHAATVMLFLSPLFPSLLMFLGMVLKKHLKKL